MKSLNSHLGLSCLLALLAGCAPSPFVDDPEITQLVDDWRDRVVYQVLVDRFANGDASNDFNVTHDDTALARYQGGDWQGLIDRVDYLSDLGVNAIWISPVVRNVEEDAGVAGYHGYWTQSFRDTNFHFGDLAKLRELVQVMHDNDIAVIVDVVVNHVGQLFYYDINHNGQPDITDYYDTNGAGGMETVTEWDPSYDSRGIQGWTTLGESGPAPIEWVYQPENQRLPPEPVEFWNDDWYNRRGRVTDWNDFDQVVHGDFPGGLKDLATENPNVRNALIQVWSDWITWTNIDGFRIDTVKHVELDFWPEFCTAIRAHAASLGKEDFLLFGESFDGDDALIGAYTFDDMLDSVAYFSQKYQVFDDVFKYGQGTAKVASLYELRQSNWGVDAQPGGVGVAPAALPINFMDNHDTARFLYDSAAAGNPDPELALASALTFLFTTEGLPVLYYGTEQGFDGGNDPTNREPLWWSDYDTSGDVFQHTAQLLALRQAHPALRYGTLEFRWTSDHTGQESDAGVLAFERVDSQETLLVAINTGDGQAAETAYEGVSMGVSFAPGTTLRELFPGTERTFTVAADGTLVLTLEPREGVVLGL